MIIKKISKKLRLREIDVVPTDENFMLPNFQTLFEAAPNLYLVLLPDTNFTIAAVSDHYLQATMTRRDQLLRRPLFEIFPDNPDDPAADGVRNLKKSLLRVIELKKADKMAPQKYDIRKPAEEGGGFEVRYWDPVNTPVFEGETIKYIIHRVADITELMRLQEKEILQSQEKEELEIAKDKYVQELKESEEKFYKAFAISPVAFAISDSATGKYIEVNESFSKLTGYSKEELLGRTSVERGMSVDAQVYEKILSTIRANGKVRNAEITIRNKTGDIIDILSSAESLTIGGKECMLTINYDITTLKESERRLKEANKLAHEAVILKETFLANMSHEIRTPMNAIIGFTELLMKRDLDEKNKDYVATIKTSGESLLRIINDILDASKIESGMMLFEEHPISIKELFVSLNNMLLQRANEKNIGLKFEYAADIPNTVLGDPTRLTQVIINLVGNAIKFTEKGNVKVSAKVLKEEAEKYDMEFSVKDSGVGISAEKLKYIFERFRQADTHTARHYGGTGLGLSIAKQLIELQGGKIRVQSIEGVGSEFIFVLPFKKTQASYNKNIVKEHKQIDMKELSTLNILMAEDNPINIKFVQSLFGDYNIHADIAMNGKEAIEKLTQKEYDIILMDIEMPEMNGYETTDIIRKELNNSIPIIAMTAHAMSGEKEKCLKLGMTDYISKPIISNILFEKIHKAVLAKSQSTLQIG